MPSRLSRSDTLHGLIVAALIVAAFFWVCAVIDRHLEEHGHNRPDAVHCVICADRDEGGRGREAQDVGHTQSLTSERAGKHVRGGRS